MILGNTDLLATVQLTGIMISLAVLSVASVSDLRTREVSDRHWLFYGPIALALFLAQILTSDNWFIVGISGGITVVIAFIMFQVGLVGGADSKALMCLGLAMPALPSFSLLRTRPYLYPAEKIDLIDSKPVRHFRLVSSVEQERSEMVSELEPYTAQGLYSDGVWVTPGLPHLIFILGSLVVSIVLGDMLMWVFTRMVGYQA